MFRIDRLWSYAVVQLDALLSLRTHTTLMDKGQSATNTKLDRNGAAHKALIEKRSFTGPSTIFGQSYESIYAPLFGEDGKLIGALFVGVPK